MQRVERSLAMSFSVVSAFVKSSIRLSWYASMTSKAKSVSLSEQAQRLSRDLFEKHFGKAL